MILAQVQQFYESLGHPPRHELATFQRYFPHDYSLNEIDDETAQTFIAHNPSANQALLLGISIGQQVVKARRPSLLSAQHSATFGHFAQKEIGGQAQEQLCLAMVDTQLNVIGWEVVFVGTLTQVTASPREIFQRALKANAYAIIMVHNHPSGNVHPSAHDLSFSQKLFELGKTMNLPLLDSFIVSQQDYWSMIENQQLERLA
ncbi:JAB domain-containing protein [Convivina intestini]|uniref:DNA repair protein RadC n=1 Tax=Convivina intestini TaxID=1505726 RepID=A0A2U1DBP2_9LACO|nr:JAB domain-containing protein [Convivina intestini]PVY85091.1 DNA repair protein RadC [Convivina intestini]CAH1853691.1 hypothetical protein R077811_00768 [Convivina intestini]SDB88691.1 DNA repair protein RadC [Leuconostocaceae bacterium R-53105]